MTPQKNTFGELTDVTRIHRVGNVCVDRDEERAMLALMAVMDVEPFGALSLVRPVIRH